MDRLIGILSSYTHALKAQKTPFRGVSLRYVGNGDEDVLRSDLMLRAHFRNFVKALRSYDHHCNTIDRSSPTSSADIINVYDGTSPGSGEDEEAWSLSNIELGLKLIHMLCPLLTSRGNLRTIVLDRNEFDGNSGVTFLLDVIETNQLLEKVSFDNNHVLDIDDRFYMTVSNHSSLKYLTLKNVSLGGDEDKLSMILNACSHLDTLGLCCNDIGLSRGSLKIIIEFLSSGNNNIMTLYLSGNSFNDESAELFASALKSNNRLRVLDLCNNEFHEGGGVICNALFDASSLGAVVESNHTCDVYLNENDRGAINQSKNPKRNMHRKVFATLYATTDGGRLGQLLDTIPIELMPEFLAHIQQYYIADIPRGIKKRAMVCRQQYTRDDFEDVYAAQTMFGIVFEAFRSWTVPLLFSNL